MVCLVQFLDLVFDETDQTAAFVNEVSQEDTV